MPADPAGSRIKADYKSGRESVHVRFHVAGVKSALWGVHARARQRQDNDKVRQGVKGIIEMHRFNICLVVVLSLSCSGVKTPLLLTSYTVSLVE